MLLKTRSPLSASVRPYGSSRRAGSVQLESCMFPSHIPRADASLPPSSRNREEAKGCADSIRSLTQEALHVERLLQPPQVIHLPGQLRLEDRERLALALLALLPRQPLLGD